MPQRKPALAYNTRCVDNCSSQNSAQCRVHSPGSETTAVFRGDVHFGYDLLLLLRHYISKNHTIMNLLWDVSSFWLLEHNGKRKIPPPWTECASSLQLPLLHNNNSRAQRSVCIPRLTLSTLWLSWWMYAASRWTQVHQRHLYMTLLSSCSLHLVRSLRTTYLRKHLVVKANMQPHKMNETKKKSVGVNAQTSDISCQRHVVTQYTICSPIRRAFCHRKVWGDPTAMLK